MARRETSIVDGRTTRHAGYQVSQRIRKRIEEVLGWVKTVGGGRKLRYKGVERNELWWERTAAAYDLLRMAKITLPPPRRAHYARPRKKWLREALKANPGNGETLVTKPIIIEQGERKQKTITAGLTMGTSTPVFQHPARHKRA